ncbi:MAG: DegT/DnrJ/EryC1/StrS family aminotransferase [Nocardioidaceae bacterium]
MSLTATDPTAARPALRVPFADCEIDPAATRAAARVLASGWVTTGREVLAFEEEFAAKVGAAHAVAVSSCTAAIELSLRSLRLEPGAPVLVSTMTFCGAVQAIIHAGLQPVLVDVDPATGMPTEETTARAARSTHPAAMVALHWAGDPADVPALAAAAGLPLDRVVEDAAHALGTVANGNPVGRGSAVCFSFYATKNLPLGEGGMVTTYDEDRAAWLRRARLHGMSADAWRRYLPGGQWRYDVEDAGLKANLTDLQAAIGRAQLRRLDAWQARRAQIAARYDERLAGLPGIGVPHRPADGDGTHAWHLYPIRIDTPALTRDEAMTLLRDRGVGTSVHFIPVHQLSYFGRNSTTPAGGLPGADVLFEQLLSLPMYPRLTDQQVDVVCDVLTESLAHSTTTVLD